MEDATDLHKDDDMTAKQQQSENSLLHARLVLFISFLVTRSPPPARLASGPRVTASRPASAYTHGSANQQCNPTRTHLALVVCVVRVLLLRWRSGTDRAEQNSGRRLIRHPPGAVRV